MRHRYELRKDDLVLRFTRLRDALWQLKTAQRTNIKLRLYRDGEPFDPSSSVRSERSVVLRLQLAGKLARSVEVYALAHKLDLQTAVLRLLAGHPILRGSGAGAP